MLLAIAPEEGVHVIAIDAVQRNELAPVRPEDRGQARLVGFLAAERGDQRLCGGVWRREWLLRGGHRGHRCQAGHREQTNEGDHLSLLSTTPATTTGTRRPRHLATATA